MDGGLCGVDGVGYVFRILDLRAQRIQREIRLAVSDATGQLDRFTIDRLRDQLLFRGDDIERIDDKVPAGQLAIKMKNVEKWLASPRSLFICPAAGFLQESTRYEPHAFSDK